MKLKHKWQEDTYVPDEVKLAAPFKEPSSVIKAKIGKGRMNIIVNDILGAEVGGRIVAQYLVEKYNCRTGKATLIRIPQKFKKGQQLVILANVLGK